MSAPTLTAPVLPPLQIGPLTIASPVVLAPMAGITNRAFRQLCREYGDEGLAAAGPGRPAAPGVGSVGSVEKQDRPGDARGAGGSACLYVSEMITSRALVERTPISMKLIEHGPEETPRSVQLYGVDPATVGRAVRMLVEEDRADHIDLNFGCPVPKVTRKGGGAALPWKTELFRGIVAAAVRGGAAGGIPVTVKMRVGIDADHLTFLDAGRIAEDEGAAAVALHARTASQAYSGRADWPRIAELKAAVTSIPVLGNGDIWSADDALAMVRETGCDGVVVGRGCLGRPWLFTDLAAAFAGSHVRVTPDLAQVCRVLRRHAELLVDFHGEEAKGCRDIRKHVSWYLKGFAVGGQVRQQLGLINTLTDLDRLVAGLDLDQAWPGDAEGQRGRAGSSRIVALPDRWLASRELDGQQRTTIAQAELSVSGG
ncbi:MAG: tRNA dihydrouridine synthase DusB [Ornithinimicrobium sp.]|uniref:tRNA dihydrouridine synthase DusB n=1 Tax=Ornithinimicrobium sp. TaxID=1977084 RepID=UPI0026E04C88|nr:tRNA dihydrouridine synthase DusB [Ornithinimicrobium sp.]MDO5739716.1 tRNA dihydrouridine synthase DusB [Ornithinimicrobium sp.]